MELITNDNIDLIFCEIQTKTGQSVPDIVKNVTRQILMFNKDKINYVADLKGVTNSATEIILGCTHYPHYKTQIATATEKILGRKIDIISQDEFLSVSLKNYLSRHPEIDKDLSKDSKYVFEITDINDAYISQAKAIFGNDNIVVQKVDI